MPEKRLLKESPERLLVIAAHPEDAELQIGGSVAVWVAGGATATLVCCTSGDSTADDADTDPLAQAALREVEQRAAADLIGYDSVTFLHRPDGALVNDLALREQLVRQIRAIRPDVVAAHDPRVLFSDDRGIEHADHREAGLATVDAVYPAAGSAMAFPHLVRSEGLLPHLVRRLFLFGSEAPDGYVDISTKLELKTQALAEHRSQVSRSAGALQNAHAVALRRGEEIGVDAAEAFSVISQV